MRILLRKSVMLVIGLSLIAMVGLGMGIFGFGDLWLVLPAGSIFAIMLLMIIRFQQILEKNGSAERKARAHRDKSNQLFSNVNRRLDILESSMTSGFMNIGESSDEFEVERQAYISYHLRETTSLLAGLSQSVSRLEQQTFDAYDVDNLQTASNSRTEQASIQTKPQNRIVVASDLSGVSPSSMKFDAYSLREWHENLCNWVSSIYTHSSGVMPRNFAGNTATIRDISAALQHESHIVDYGIDAATFMLADQCRSDEQLYVIESDPRLVSFVAQELGDQCLAYASPSSALDGALVNARKANKVSVAVLLSEPGPAELDSIRVLAKKMDVTEHLCIAVTSRWERQNDALFTDVDKYLSDLGLKISPHRSLENVQVWTNGAEYVSNG